MVGTKRECAIWLTQADENKVYQVTEYRAKRSKSQNGYFHTLSDQIADARTLRGDTISKAAEKNELIAKYGQKYRQEDGTPIGLKVNVPPEKMREMEEPHTLFIRETDDGAYMYFWMRPSREYDTKEMAALIDGTVEDAKAWGVETLTPFQLQELRKLEERNAKHHSE